jgi:hypothetical protein
VPKFGGGLVVGWRNVGPRWHDPNALGRQVVRRGNELFAESVAGGDEQSAPAVQRAVERGLDRPPWPPVVDAAGPLVDDRGHRS